MPNIKLRSGEGSLDLDFDPSKYSTKAGAAKALYRALVKLNKELGGADGEVIIRSPKEDSPNGYPCWWVCWEGGPYSWACPTSFDVSNHTAGWYSEPYWSFDLAFCE